MKDSCTFYQDIYRDTLDNVLPQWSEDDMNEHGRLIVMRDVLTHLTGTEEISKDNPIMKHFYRKDIEVLKRTASDQLPDLDDFTKAFTMEEMQAIS